MDIACTWQWDDWGYKIFFDSLPGSVMVQHRQPWKIINMGVSWNRGAPSHHPFGDRVSLMNQPAMGVPPWLWKPPWLGHGFQHVPTIGSTKSVLGSEGAGRWNLWALGGRSGSSLRCRKSKETYGGFHSHGGTTIAWWLIGKSHRSKGMITRGTPISGNPHMDKNGKHSHKKSGYRWYSWESSGSEHIEDALKRSYGS